MKTQHNVLVSALALSLAACSGNGGTYQPYTDHTNTPAVQPQNGGGQPAAGNPNNGNNQPTTPPATGNPNNGGSNQPTTPPTANNPNNGGNNPSTNPPSANNPNNGGSNPSTNPPSANNPNNGGNNPVTQPPASSTFEVNRPAAAQQAEIQKAVENTNKLRAEKGLKPLAYDPALSAYAQKRAEEIVRLFEHTRPDGQSWQTGVKNGAAAENIAAGKATADGTVLEQWRNSSGHYQNMMGSQYTRLGIGLVHVPGSQYGYYWVQIFGDDRTTTDYSFGNAAATPRSVAMMPAEASQIDALSGLNIDGRAIALTPSGQADWHAINAAGYTGEFGGNTAFSRYGVVKQNGEQAYRTFHQGLSTPLEQMPQSGSAQYRGQGVAVRGSDKHYLNAEFDVNFGRKQLNGTLSNDTQRFGVNADIRGNTFASPESAAVQTEGGFFGPDAAELSGTFDDRAGSKGAFGATR